MKAAKTGLQRGWLNCMGVVLGKLQEPWLSESIHIAMGGLRPRPSYCKK